MYRIFINDNTLILSGSKEILKGFENAEIEQYSCSSCMNRAIAKLENDVCTLLVLQGSLVELMWDDFCSRYKSIEAAGGIVTNLAKEVLWIRRNEKWDLPKGKVEIGEEIEDTAVREVEEECNVNGLEIIKEVASTFHCYTTRKGKWALKRTYWYEMNTHYMGELIPQVEEGIERVEWVNKDNIESLKMNTYKSLIDVFDSID